MFKPIKRILLSLMVWGVAPIAFAWPWHITPCNLELVELNAPESSLIAILKINTQKEGVYSSRVEVSDDCINYRFLYQTKYPHIYPAKKGFCTVLSTTEIAPSICRVRHTVCLEKHLCQFYVINLYPNQANYGEPLPAYYEMTFSRGNEKGLHSASQYSK